MRAGDAPGLTHSAASWAGIFPNWQSYNSFGLLQAWTKTPRPTWVMQCFPHSVVFYVNQEHYVAGTTEISWKQRESNNIFIWPHSSRRHRAKKRRIWWVFFCFALGCCLFSYLVTLLSNAPLQWLLKPQPCPCLSCPGLLAALLPAALALVTLQLPSLVGCE